MKPSLGLSLCALLAVSSCEKAKHFVSGEDASLGSPASLPEIDAVSYARPTSSPGRLAVVVFGAEWCGACRQMEPLVGKMAAEFKERVVVGKVDVDRAHTFAKAENVTLIPEIRFFRDRKQVARSVGGMEEAALRELFEKHAAGPAAAPGGPATENPPPITPMKKDWLPPGLEKR